MFYFYVLHIHTALLFITLLGNFHKYRLVISQIWKPQFPGDDHDPRKGLEKTTSLRDIPCNRCLFNWKSAGAAAQCNGTYLLLSPFSKALFKHVDELSLDFSPPPFQQNMEARKMKFVLLLQVVLRGKWEIYFL